MAATAPSITPPDAETADAARRLSDGQAKPLGALGGLEPLGAWLAACQRTCPPRQLEDVRVVVFAGDHGVAAAGVSAYPASITPAMVRGIAAGGAGISALGRANGVQVMVRDLGVAEDFPDLDPEISRFKVNRGSGRIDLEDALTEQEVLAALEAGDTLAEELISDGAQLLIAGDLGIGNTTTASTLIAATYGLTASAVVGTGTGIDEAALARKTAVIAAALARAGDRVKDPVQRLAALGSADTAAAVGFMLGSARRGVPVLLDGLIAVSEAAVAASIDPVVVEWMRAGHRSSEPGQWVALAAMGLEPLLDLRMRLGEGTGAVVALPVLRSAVAALRDIAQLADLT